MSPTRIPAPPFGRVFTEHMAYGEWSQEAGWGPLRVGARTELALDAAAAVLHYGQAMFEGCKAYRGADGGMRVFRLDDHLRRMQRGASRICLPEIDVPATRAAILELLRTDESWLPEGPGESIYIRPLLVATEAFLGVRPAQRCALVVLLSPVGNYYDKGAKPLSLWVERDQVRAAPGGIGAIKTGGNYAASLSAAALAKTRGFDQVLWLDGVERKWLEEVGTMNLFVKIGDELVTPPLGGTILPGITRDSVLRLTRDAGGKVSERPISIDEVLAAARAGTLRAIFGTGTAAVIAPVGELGFGDERFAVPTDDPVAPQLLETISALQRGRIADPHGWSDRITSARVPKAAGADRYVRA